MLSVLLYSLILLPLVFICKKQRRKYVVLFLLALTGINIVRVLTSGLMVSILSMNWVGKILATIASLLFIAISSRYSKDLTTKSYKLSLGKYKDTKLFVIVICTIFFLISLSTYFLFSKYSQKFDIENLLFQLTIPGIDEEIFFRGICLTLLNLAFVKRLRIFGVDFGLGILIVTIQFALGHSLFFDINNGFYFSLFNFSYTAIIGLILGILAESTKSILLPLVAHNSYNVIVTLISIFR